MGLAPGHRSITSWNPAVSSAQLGTGIVQGRLWSWSGIPGSVDTEEATRTLNVLESYNMPLVLLPHIDQIMTHPRTDLITQ